MVWYDDFYKGGGFGYKNPEKEKEFLEKRIIEPLKLKKGMSLLDIGCGMGFHTTLFTELGFKVLGTDYSSVAIDYAREHFPETKFVLSPLETFSPPEKYDIIYARGMSWYHYELNSVNVHGYDIPRETARLFKHFLKKGGYFILQIHTDYTGTHNYVDGIKSTINNKLSEYKKLFRQFGKIVYISDWRGKILEKEKDTPGALNIIIATKYV